MAISPSGSTAAGETYSLICSATLHSHNPPLPDPNIPSPIFEWFFGPNGNAPLPSGLTPTATVLSSGTYTSTLQFSLLSQSHAGNYTCRLGAGSLVNNVMVTVNGRCITRVKYLLISTQISSLAPPISVIVTANLNTPLMVGQTGNTLTCGVSGAERLSPTIDYQWTRNDGTTQTQVVTNSSTLTLSIRLSDAGDFTCSVTIGSTLLNNDITVSAGNAQRVMIQSE